MDGPARWKAEMIRRVTGVWVRSPVIFPDVCSGRRHCLPLDRRRFAWGLEIILIRRNFLPA